VPDDISERLPLVGGCGFIEGDDGPVHLPLREVAAQVAVDPELGASEIDAAVMSLVDFVSVVELAEVFRLAVFVVNCRMCVEIADAEVWTAARLNGRGVDRPVRSRRSRMTRADAKQGDHSEQCDSMHRSTPFARQYAPAGIAAQEIVSDSARRVLPERNWSSLVFGSQNQLSRPTDSRGDDPDIAISMRDIYIAQSFFAFFPKIFIAKNLRARGMVESGQNLDAKGLASKIFCDKDLAPDLEPLKRSVVEKFLSELARIGRVCALLFSR